MTHELDDIRGAVRYVDAEYADKKDATGVEGFMKDFDVDIDAASHVAYQRALRGVLQGMSLDFNEENAKMVAITQLSTLAFLSASWLDGFCAALATERGKNAPIDKEGM